MYTLQHLKEYDLQFNKLSSIFKALAMSGNSELKGAVITAFGVSCGCIYRNFA
jgi:hypothetical protein